MIKNRYLKSTIFILAFTWLALEIFTGYVSRGAWTIEGTPRPISNEIIEIENKLYLAASKGQEAKGELSKLQKLSFSDIDALIAYGNWTLLSGEPAEQKEVMSKLKRNYLASSPHDKWRIGSVLARAYSEGIGVNKVHALSEKYASETRGIHRQFVKKGLACDRASVFTVTFWARCEGF